MHITHCDLISAQCVCSLYSMITFLRKKVHPTSLKCHQPWLFLQASACQKKSYKQQQQQQQASKSSLAKDYSKLNKTNDLIVLRDYIHSIAFLTWDAKADKYQPTLAITVINTNNNDSVSLTSLGHIFSLNYKK